jgi:hypothetical protein
VIGFQPREKFCLSSKWLIVLTLPIFFFSWNSKALALPLQTYMYQFVTLASDLRMENIKGKNPDWKAISITLKEMEKNVQAMQTADTDNAYKAYLDKVSFSLAQLKKMSKKHDPNISAGFDQLTQSCLDCHFTHIQRAAPRFKTPE